MQRDIGDTDSPGELLQGELSFRPGTIKLTPSPSGLSRMCHQKGEIKMHPPWPLMRNQVATLV